MNYLDLFSGIAGFRLGFQRAGIEFEKEYHSEIDKYARSIYEKQFPKSVGLGDITKIKPETLSKIDLITFGFPCQDLSIAGKRKGITGGRSGLFYEALRLIQVLQPSIFIFENVKGLYSSNDGKDFTAVLRAITDLGLYECEWQLLNTKWFLPQNRERIYFIGHLGKGSGQKVFPITENDRLYKDGKIYTGQEYDTKQGRELCDPKCRKSGSNKIKVIANLSNSNERNVLYDKNGLSPALNTSQGGGLTPLVKAVLTPGRKEKRQNGRRMKEDGEDMFTLTGQDQHGVEIIDSISEYQGDIVTQYDSDSHPCLSSQGGNKLKGIGIQQENSSIRRLTPTECARLQGFPDNWCDGISDSQQYKCYGNAVSVPVVECIARKLFK